MQGLISLSPISKDFLAANDCRRKKKHNNRGGKNEKTKQKDDEEKEELKEKVVKGQSKKVILDEKEFPVETIVDYDALTVNN